MDVICDTSHETIFIVRTTERLGSVWTWHECVGTHQGYFSVNIEACHRVTTVEIKTFLSSAQLWTTPRKTDNKNKRNLISILLVEYVLNMLTY